MKLDDSTLVLATRRTQTLLFDRFVSDQRGALLSFLRRLTGSEADAEDLVQESFLSLVRYRAAGTAEHWRPLLFRIALNAFNDRQRARASGRAGPVSLQESHADQLPSADAPYEQRLSDQQELALISAALQNLPARCRQIYLLNRVEEMSYSEIARHCAISVKAVEKQISKALAILRVHCAAGSSSTKGVQR